jgi:hypothetical protein
MIDKPNVRGWITVTANGAPYEGIAMPLIRFKPYESPTFLM